MIFREEDGKVKHAREESRDGKERLYKTYELDIMAVRTDTCSMWLSFAFGWKTRKLSSADKLQVRPDKISAVFSKFSRDESAQSKQSGLRGSCQR